MKTIKTIDSAQHVYAFTPEMAPVSHIAPGEMVRFDALDALGGQVRAETDILAGLDFDRVNPATGPVAVSGAKLGDTLSVTLHSIEMDEQGAIVTGPGMGVLGDEMEASATRMLPIRNAAVEFRGLKLPVRPMVGVIGVATETGRYATGTAHRHGGNMDTKEIGVGSTVYLPVSQDGAQLAMGDVHAVMGDGEVCVSACEVAARIVVETAILKATRLAWPMVETSEQIHVLVSLPTIEEALIEATRCAVSLLQRAHGLSKEDAYMLASLAVDIGVSQLVDPNKTAKASIPKYALPGPLTDWLAGHDWRGDG